jgi:hypothetical protein
VREKREERDEMKKIEKRVVCGCGLPHIDICGEGKGRREGMEGWRFVLG